MKRKDVFKYSKTQRPHGPGGMAAARSDYLDDYKTAEKNKRIAEGGINTYDALRGLDNNLNSSGLRIGESALDQHMSFKAISKNKRNAEKEEVIQGSLTERAQRVVTDPNYVKKIQDIKHGRSTCRYMDFVMDGIKIGMPYNGQKVTQGYLKKETQSLGILLQRTWQLKYCVLDLTRFLFKYAKNPTEVYTNIHLKEIIDVVVEEDPARKDDDKSIFSLGR